MADTDELVAVYVGLPWQAGQVQGILESAGITSFLRNELMGTIEAPLLSAGGFAAVRVVVPRAEFERAEEVIRDFGGQNGLLGEEAPIQAPDADPVAVWNCKRCGEEVETRLDVCWSCGADRGRPA